MTNRLDYREKKKRKELWRNFSRNRQSCIVWCPVVGGGKGVLELEVKLWKALVHYRPRRRRPWSSVAPRTPSLPSFSSLISLLVLTHFFETLTLSFFQFFAHFLVFYYSTLLLDQIFPSSDDPLIPLYTDCITCIVIHLLLKIWTELHIEAVLVGISIGIFSSLYLIYAIPIIIHISLLTMSLLW